jgi:hypothetical protein
MRRLLRASWSKALEYQAQVALWIVSGASA